MAMMDTRIEQLRQFELVESPRSRRREAVKNAALAAQAAATLFRGWKLDTNTPNFPRSPSASIAVSRAARASKPDAPTEVQREPLAPKAQVASEAAPDKPSIEAKPERTLHPERLPRPESSQQENRAPQPSQKLEPQKPRRFANRLPPQKRQAESGVDETQMLPESEGSSQADLQHRLSKFERKVAARRSSRGPAEQPPQDPMISPRVVCADLLEPPPKPKLQGMTPSKIPAPKARARTPSTPSRLRAPAAAAPTPEPSSRPSTAGALKRPASAKRAPRRRADGGPFTVPCYLCNKQFSVQSLMAHERPCRKLLTQQNEQLEQPERVELVERPECLSLIFELCEAGQRADAPEHSGLVEDYKHFCAAAGNATQKPCAHCGRTFDPERLEVHQRSCKPKTPAASKGKPAPKRTPARARAKPEPQEALAGLQEQGSELQGARAVRVETLAVDELKSPLGVAACRFCSRQFSKRSLAIHEKACQRVASRQQLASTVAAEPEDLLEPGALTASLGVSCSSYSSQLVACTGCLKAYRHDRIAAHQEQCQHLSRREQAAPRPGSNETAQCSCCHQSFKKSLLRHHERACRFHKEQAERREAPELQEFVLSESSGAEEQSGPWEGADVRQKVNPFAARSRLAMN